MEGNISNKPITFDEIAVAFARNYESVYIINVLDDSYVEYITEDDNDRLITRSSGDNFYADTIKNCRAMVYPDDQEIFLSSFTVLLSIRLFV